MTLGVLIVDDEPPARAKIRRLLELDARFRVVGEAADGVEALELVERTRPDIVVLDVQMPGPNGFQVLDALGEAVTFTVVFSTAFEEHALRAFEAHAVDYLLKPYEPARFRRAMEKALSQRLGAREWQGLLSDTVGPSRSRLALRTVDGAWITLLKSDILRLRSADKRTRILLPGGAEHVVRRSLGDLEALVGDTFTRVHRTDVVNVSAVLRMDPLGHGDALLVLSDGTSCVLTRTYRAEFMKRWLAMSTPQ